MLFKRLLIALGLLVGLLALADRGLATLAGNATGEQIRVREGLGEDAEVTFKGFPFLTQAARGRFREVDVTIRDVERSDVVIDRIDATLTGVEVDLGDALKGRVRAVPVEQGDATLRIAYGDIQTYLARQPGNIRIVVRDGQPYVVSSVGVPGAGQVDVEGTPSVRATKTSVRIDVSRVRAVSGDTTLSAEQARRAGVRSSFTIPLGDLPFGIEVTRARLTDSALLVDATATGFVIESRDGAG